MTAAALCLLLAGCAQATAPAETGRAGSASTTINLEGTEWVLASLRGQPPIDRSLITLKFERGSVAGSGGCNSYTGTMPAANGRLEPGPLASTKRGCMAPGVTEQESAYLEALGQAVAYEASESRLVVHDRAGAEILIFTRRVN